jgi:cytochrome c oxidase subunit 3
MPPTISPPDIERHHRDGDIREGDIGNGRRPPIDKHTGGNGEGDNWNDRPQGSRGPRERLSQVRTGLFFGLFAVLMFFVAIVSAFFVSRSTGHIDAYSRYVSNWMPTVLPSILWLNTAILIISSTTAELARRSMFHEHEVMEEWLGLGRPTSRRAALWLSITFALGVLFLVGQCVAWKQLAATLHPYLSNPSTHYFYLITIAHAAHLFIGVTALAVALVILHRSRRMLTRQIFVDATVWYWHAMGLLWVALFAVLVFCQ